MPDLTNELANEIIASLSQNPSHWTLTRVDSDNEMTYSHQTRLMTLRLWPIRLLMFGRRIRVCVQDEKHNSLECELLWRDSRKIWKLLRKSMYLKYTEENRTAIEKSLLVARQISMNDTMGIK